MSYLDAMSSDEITECLLKDMEMLDAGTWEPDSDSIEAHCGLIKELQRRLAVYRIKTIAMGVI